MTAIRQPSHVIVWLAYVHCLLWCKRFGWNDVWQYTG